MKDENVIKDSSNRRFRLGRTPYISTKKVTFPIIMKTDDDAHMKREVTAHVIESDEVDFLCGEETLQGWRAVLDFEEKKIRFKGIERMVKVEKQSHLVIKLHLGDTWQEDEEVLLVTEEKEQDAKDDEKEKPDTFGENIDSNDKR